MAPEAEEDFCSYARVGVGTAPRSAGRSSLSQALRVQWSPSKFPHEGSWGKVQSRLGLGRPAGGGHTAVCWTPALRQRGTRHLRGDAPSSWSSGCSAPPPRDALSTRRSLRGRGCPERPLRLQGLSASGNPLSVPRTLSTGLSTSGVGMGRARPPGDHSGDPVLWRRTRLSRGRAGGPGCQPGSAPRWWGWGKRRAALSAAGAGGRWAPALRGGGSGRRGGPCPCARTRGRVGPVGERRGWGCPRRKGEARGLYEALRKVALCAERRKGDGCPGGRRGRGLDSPNPSQQ